MAQRVGEASGGVWRCGPVGDTGSLPKGHCGEMVVATLKEDVAQGSLCRIMAETGSTTPGSSGAFSLSLKAG